MCTSASNVAKIIIGFSDPENGDGLTNLKLQKLLYYAQGAFLAIKNKKLFNEDIVAWQYGPVVPRVYGEYKKYGNNIIDKKESRDIEEISGSDYKLLKEVYNTFGQLSAIALMNLSHSETPYEETPMNGIIDTNKIKKYFKNHYVRS